VGQARATFPPTRHSSQIQPHTVRAIAGVLHRQTAHSIVLFNMHTLDRYDCNYAALICPLLAPHTTRPPPVRRRSVTMPYPTNHRTEEEEKRRFVRHPQRYATLDL